MKLWPKMKPPKEEIRFIEVPFQRLNIRDDDVIVLSLPNILSWPAWNRLRRQAQEVFRGHKVIVLEDGLTLGVAAKEDGGFGR